VLESHSATILSLYAAVNTRRLRLEGTSVGGNTGLRVSVIISIILESPCAVKSQVAAVSSRLTQRARRSIRDGGVALPQNDSPSSRSGAWQSRRLGGLDVDRLFPGGP
jgi:hypothetical protein